MAPSREPKDRIQEIKNVIKDSLSIEISRSGGGFQGTLEVELILDGDVISTDFIYLDELIDD